MLTEIRPGTECYGHTLTEGYLSSLQIVVRYNQESSTMMTEIQKNDNKWNTSYIALEGFKERLKRWSTNYKRGGHTFSKIVHQATVIPLRISVQHLKTFGCNENLGLLLLFIRNISSYAHLWVNHLASLHFLLLESFHHVCHCVHNTRPAIAQTSHTQIKMTQTNHVKCIQLLSNEHLSKIST